VSYEERLEQLKSCPQKREDFVSFTVIRRSLKKLLIGSIVKLQE
jgi:hypothetical protein